MLWLLNLRLNLRRRHLLLAASLLPVITLILAIVLRRLWNHDRLLRLLERWLGLLRPAALLTAALLTIVLPVNLRLRNHRWLSRLRRTILLTEGLTFALRIHLADLTTRT